MIFTEYGKRLAKDEPVPEAHPLGGATAHMKACEYDADKTLLLTGKDANGKRIRRVAKSVYGAFMTSRAMWGIERAWHVLPDGSRRLVMYR